MGLNKIKIKLMVTKNIDDSIIKRKKGELINYDPWEFNWGSMTEPERRKKGLFVHCYGMGEFEVWELGDNVAIYPY